MRPIDADAVLGGYNARKVTEYDESGCGVDYMAVSVEVLNNAPTLDVAPVRHGRWVDSDIKYAVTELLEGEYPETLTCSICGFKHKFADEYGYSCIWHYCPNCGAKMRGDEDAAE